MSEDEIERKLLLLSAGAITLAALILAGFYKLATS